MGSPRRSQLTSAHLTRAATRSKTREKLEAGVRVLIQRHAPKLHDGVDGAGLDSPTLNKIIDELSTSFDAHRRARQALERVLRGMQKITNGQVRLPAPAVPRPRKSSPFHPKAFGPVVRLSELIDAFTRHIERERNVTEELGAARIVFSAIAFGGLLCESLIERLPVAIVTSLHAYKDECWINFDLQVKATDARRVRRWFPDPVTQCLIVQWVQSGRVWPNRSIDQLLQSLLGHISHGSGGKRKTLMEVLQPARTRARLMVPGLLVDFLQSDDHGCSLGEYAWWRVRAGHYLNAPILPAPQEESAQEFCTRVEPSANDPTQHRSDSSEDLEAVRRLKQSLLKKPKVYFKPAAAKRSVMELRNSLGERGPIFTALLDWAEWQLELLSTGERRAKPQSIHRYLTSIAHRLVATGGEVDPEKVPAAELEKLYREVLSSISSTAECEYAVVRLRDFHSFLTLTRDVIPVEIQGEVSGWRNVRANVIAEGEFQRALDYWRDADLDERTRCMRRVMLVLAYRLGPRRNELLYARISDLQAGIVYTSPRPLLWIHSHPDASLKTYASLRRLPLAHLVPPKELHEVKQWLALRLSETSISRQSQALLFCEQGVDTKPLPDHEVDPLVEELRLLCEDDTIVLHNLRHSFLSNLFTHVFIAEIEARTSRKIDCPWLRSDKTFHPLRRLFQTDVLPREAAYLLAALAGHIDPAETMHSYIHFQDWIAGLFFRELASQHKVALWAALEGISTEALNVRHSRGKKAGSGNPIIPHLDTPRRMLARLAIKPPEGHAAQKVTALIPAPAPTPLLMRLPLEAVYATVALLGKQMTFAKRQHLTGIDRATYVKLLEVTLELAKTETANRDKKVRRSRILAPKEKRRRPLLSRLPQLEGFGPAIPRPDQERKDARQIFRSSVSAGDRATADDLWFLLQRTSHSDPILRLHSVDDVNRATSVLMRLGIPRRRLTLEIKSVPRGQDDRTKWFRRVASRTGFAATTIIGENNSATLPTAIRRHGEGVFVLRIHSGKGLTYGWRVGAYYALCVLRTVGVPPPVDA